jgi:hypothetical protein
MRGGGQPSAALSVGSRAVGKRKTLAEIHCTYGLDESQSGETCHLPETPTRTNLDACTNA